MSNAANVDLEKTRQKEFLGHPVGLYILFFTELWERFSFYGMRAILTLYMTARISGENPGLGWGEGFAFEIYGWYGMLVYVLSIPGGIIADKFIGQKKTVLFGGLILVAGHSILAIEATWAFMLGLILIVLGVGGLKPNISTMVGGLYPQGDPRRDSGFTIFYIGINIGAFLASLTVGFVGETIGWHYGFGMAGIGMLIGLLVYLFGQRYLKGIGEAPKASANQQEEEAASLGQLFRNLLKSPFHLVVTIVLMVVSVILGFSLMEGGDRYAYTALFIFLSISSGMMMMVYQDVNKVEKDRFIVLLLSFLIVIVFWGAFEQAGGLLNIYTKQKLDRVVSLPVLDWIFFLGTGLAILFGVYKLIKKQQTGYIIGGAGLLGLVAYFLLRSNILTDPYRIPAAVFQSVNPFFIIIFGTAVAGFWLWWRRKGFESSSLFKMAVGTMIMGSGFLFMAIAATQAGISPEAKGALIWLIICYLLNTLGELSASPVALSFITKIAPMKYVSIMMGFYFAATGLGNKLAGVVGQSSQVDPLEVQVTEKDTRSFVADSVLEKQKEGTFTVYPKIESGDDGVRLAKHGKDYSDLLNLKQAQVDKLRERAGQVTEEQPVASLRFIDVPDSDLKKGQNPYYNVEITVFQVANRREFRTYLIIFGFTAAFGILLLLFLKKLKKLTHGAEDEADTHHEEQEPYEVADREEKS